jgi:hypothetical protein
MAGAGSNAKRATEASSKGKRFSNTLGANSEGSRRWDFFEVLVGGSHVKVFANRNYGVYN